MKKTIVLLLLLVLSGCGYRNVPKEDFLQVKEGMDEDEVILRLGDPLAKEVHDDNDWPSLKGLTDFYYKVEGDWWEITCDPRGKVKWIKKTPDVLQDDYDRWGGPIPPVD